MVPPQTRPAGSTLPSLNRPSSRPGSGSATWRAGFPSNDISYSSNVDIKNTYRTQLINSILQYGITIIAMIVMQLLIMAIVIRNRINRRKEKMMLLHSLGMRRGKIVSVCMLEALRESVWCVITMPLLLLMELLMFTGFVRKL